MHSSRTPYAPSATPLPASIAFAESDGSSPRLVVQAAEPFVWGRVVPVSVELHFPPSVLAIAAANPKSVQVRTSILGCLIDAPDASLHPVNGPSAVVHVTPLAHQPRLEGWVEVIENGQPIQRVAFRPRMAHRRLTIALALATVCIPIIWWAFAGPDTLGASLTERLPVLGGVTAAVARVVNSAARIAGAIEFESRFGFWLASALAIATLASAWRDRSRRRTLANELLLSPNPTPSARTRRLPPYLTPVSPAEMASSNP